ncbi:DUF3800 domain-containing protein [Devosia sp. UYZn731]|uniref:DUF3800 domain-containing protein n=1 Tax=Devosia sp. UYZn731 TaxID=3156345 RepID=UPI003393561C
MCFIDESGTPAKLGADKPRYFVLAGLVIPEERWPKVALQLRGLKARYNYWGELKWRFFAPGNRGDDNPMAAWDQARRNEFREKHSRSSQGTDL